MGYTCFVPNCKSGYKSNKDKVSLFKPPKKEELLRKWANAIRRQDKVLTSKDRVCELHFKPSEVLRKRWSASYNGNIIMEGTKTVSSLIPGAVPSIFPNSPTYLSNFKTERKPPTVRFSQPRKRRKIAENAHAEASTESCTVDTGVDVTSAANVLHCSTLSIKNEFPEPNEKENQSEFQDDFFEILWHNNITLPSDSWGKHVLHHPKSRAVVYCEISFLDNTISPLCTKQVLIKEDMSVEVFVLNKSVDVSVLLNMQNPKNTEELEEFLYRVDVLRVCIEGPTIKSLEDIPPELGYKDISGRWRHNECPLLMYLDLKCEKCCSLFKPLFDRRKRKVNPLEESPAEKYKKHIDATKKIPNQLINQILLKKLRGDYDS